MLHGCVPYFEKAMQRHGGGAYGIMEAGVRLNWPLRDWISNY